MSEPPRKKRTANYRHLNARVDAAILHHAVCTQIHYARVEADAYYDQLRSPADAINRLSAAAHRAYDVCSPTCVAEELPVMLHVVKLEADAEPLARMRSARHMFLPQAAVDIIGRMGYLSLPECATCTVHVCSQFCPFAIAQAYPDMIVPSDDNSTWADAYWHGQVLELPQLPSPIYYCTTHARAHVCASTCEYTFDGRSGTKTCPISQRTITDDMQNTFGDGVGTEQQKKQTDEAKTEVDNIDNDRRRQSMRAARTRLFEAATVIVAGKRVRRTAGVRASTAMRRKAAKARQTTADDQQQRVVTSASAAEVASCRPFNYRGPADLQTVISAIPQVPFSERTPRYDHAFALDRLHAMFHRVGRRATFTLSDAISRQVMFGNSHVFAICCERAAAIFRQLMVGRERQAIEAARLERAQPKAEKAIEQYVADCARSNPRTPVVASRCLSAYEATLSTQTRRYPAVTLSAEMYAATEASYAMRATMFYFGLFALPVRNVRMMRLDEIDTIRTAFSFESFCVVIYDLMRTGFTIRGVRLLERDTFLVERLFPSSSCLKHIGMTEKPCTNIKGLITTMLKIALAHGVSLDYCLDTTLPWATVAELSYETDPARRVVETIVARRWQQLHALRAVRPPSPEPADE